MAEDNIDNSTATAFVATAAVVGFGLGVAVCAVVGNYRRSKQAERTWVPYDIQWAREQAQRSRNVGKRGGELYFLGVADGLTSVLDGHPVPKLHY